MPSLLTIVSLEMEFPSNYSRVTAHVNISDLLCSSDFKTSLLLPCVDHELSLQAKFQVYTVL